MPHLPAGISSMKLKVSTFEQEISSASLGNNSIQINEQIKNAFNNQPAGTIFNPSIAVTYSDTAFPSVSEILTPTVIPNYVPKKITPSISLADIPNKLTTDSSFTIVPSITDRGTGLLSYSSSHESVANVDASGVVTIFGAGTATITVSLAASADRVYAAASVLKSFTVLPVTVLPPQSNTWSRLGQDIDGEAAGDLSGYSVSLSANGNRLAIGASNNDGNGSDSGHVRVYQLNQTLWEQLGQDIDGEAAGDGCQYVSLSADGNILAIGAPYNYGNGSESGHVRVYQLNQTSSLWTQLGQDIDGEAATDYSGWSVSLSADGNRLAIGAPYNDGNIPNTTDADGNMIESNAGHVRVYQLNQSSSLWAQLGQDIDGEAAGEGRQSVTLSADGNRLAIGALDNDGNGSDSGHVRVYYWDTEATPKKWTQLGEDIDGEAAGDLSGYSVSLSADGNRLAIGAPYNNGNSSDLGHVRVYYWDTEATPKKWTQLGQDIDGEATTDYSGWSVSLSADGNILAIGSPSNDTPVKSAGQVRVYQLNQSSLWVQLGQDINDGEDNFDNSGWSVSLSKNQSGNPILAIGIIRGTGLNNGRVRVYKYE